MGGIVDSRPAKTHRRLKPAGSRCLGMAVSGVLGRRAADRRADSPGGKAGGGSVTTPSGVTGNAGYGVPLVPAAREWDRRADSPGGDKEAG